MVADEDDVARGDREDRPPGDGVAGLRIDGVGARRQIDDSPAGRLGRRERRADGDRVVGDAVADRAVGIDIVNRQIRQGANGRKPGRRQAAVVERQRRARQHIPILERLEP